MANLGLVAVTFTLFAVCGLPTQAAVPLSALQANFYSVSVQSLTSKGVSSPAPTTPCTNPSLDSPCISTLQAEEDSMIISYGPATGVQYPPGATVSIVACYSNVSAFNRPWRANSQKTDVLLDRSCHFKIKSSLPAATPGTVTFAPPAESPTSTVYVRAYVYSAPLAPIGYGQAPGFYKIHKIESPSHGVKSAAIGMCFAGPVILAIALPLDTYLTKRRKHH